MTDKHISDVPARIWEEGRPPKLRVWDAEFNVASWIKVTGATGEVTLLVRYDDEAGTHDCVVDRSSVNSEASSLMSGLVRMRFTGKVGRVQEIGRASCRERV